MGLSLSGKTKPFCFGGRNALENVAQERSWFCPAIERALGLLPSIALSSHPTDLIVGSGRRKSIGLRLKTDCRRSTLNSLIFGLDTGEYLSYRCRIESGNARVVGYGMIEIITLRKTSE